MKKDSVHLLLVEDNDADAHLFRVGMSETSSIHSLQVVTDGAMALQYLRREGRFSSAPTPDLVLLDLNLPIINGFEVLTAMRGHTELKRIPVVILTSSRAERDVNAAYDSGANAYMQKAADLDGTMALVKEIENYWIQSAVLPGQVHYLFRSEPV